MTCRMQSSTEKLEEGRTALVTGASEVSDNAASDTRRRYDAAIYDVLHSLKDEQVADLA
jgi:hypothetical protein